MPGMDNAVTPAVPAPIGSSNAVALPAAPAPLVPAMPGLGTRIAALPARSRWIAGAAGLALVGALVLGAQNARQGDYRLLFANLSEREGGAIIEKLAQMNVPYRFAEGSGTLMVPAERVYELRFKLASAGLSRGTVIGNELLDKTPFGQTQAQEQSSQKRALEGELTKTIQGFPSVQSARVHLAVPQQNGFFREQQKPSASVVVNLHPGRTLDSAQLAGIAALISNSVPELSPKAISVVDGNGALLSNPPDATTPQGLDAQQVQYLRDVEAQHVKRVLQLLEPVVGRENLRATVTADIDFSQVESTAEEFKPNQGDQPAAVRAVRNEESSSPAPSANGGVPGALSNQPPTPATAPVNGAAQQQRAAQPAGATPGSTRREGETRYEVDKKVSVTRLATGVVRRLNAAVVVNHRTTKDAKGKPTTVPLPPEEIEKLTALVEQGIGFNKARGDSVRVVNAPFMEVAAPPVEPTPWWKEPWIQDLARQSAMPAALALVGLVLVLGVIRPALKPAFTPPAPPQEPATTPGQRIDAVVDDDNVLPGANPSRPALAAPEPPSTLEAVRGMARQNPAAVANVLRGWVSGEAA
jgi:flagellar M-ring protein FliF